jgi:hypothetical protein
MEKITAIPENHEKTNLRAPMGDCQVTGYDHGSVEIRTSSNFLRKG